MLENLLHGGGNDTGRDGKAETIGGCIIFSIDGGQGWDTNKVSLHIDQRTTTIARVDCGIGLDRV